MTYEDYKKLLQRQFDLKEKYMENKAQMKKSLQDYLTYRKIDKELFQEILKIIQPPI